MDISEILKEARKKKGLTQAELANSLGVTDRAISNWENGKRLPDYTLIYKLCDKLDIDINKLFMSDDDLIKKYYKEKTNLAGIILSIVLLFIGIICVINFKYLYSILALSAIIIYILVILDLKKVKYYKKTNAVVESVKKLYFIKINKKSFRKSLYKDSYFPLLIKVKYIVNNNEYIRKKIVFKDINIEKEMNISIIYRIDKPGKIRVLV